MVDILKEGHHPKEMIRGVVSLRESPSECGYATTVLLEKTEGSDLNPSVCCKPQLSCAGLQKQCGVLVGKGLQLVQIQSVAPAPVMGLDLGDATEVVVVVHHAGVNQNMGALGREQVVHQHPDDESVLQYGD